jgi:hypothetical protein
MTTKFNVGDLVIIKGGAGAHHMVVEIQVSLSGTRYRLSDNLLILEKDLSKPPPALLLLDEPRESGWPPQIRCKNTTGRAIQPDEQILIEWGDLTEK